MRQADILFKGENAGRLTQHDDGAFTFRYDDFWLANSEKPPISLTFPKSQKEYHAISLLPFFFNMLPEGYNKQVACKWLRIDEDDHFGLLLNTARYDTVGAVTVLAVSEPT